MATDSPLLVLEGIGKSFGSAQVLRDVDLHLRAGEVLALLGANGAGKSTLVKILCGVYRRDAGTVRLDGEQVHLTRPEEAIAHGVRFLPQEVSVLPDLSVAENILIADLPLKRTWRGREVDRSALRDRAVTLLDRLGSDSRTLDDRRADLGFLAVVEHQHRRDRQSAARFAFELLDGNHIAIGDAILLPAGLNHCVHVPHPLCRGIRTALQRGLTNAECSSKNKADRE